MDLRELQLQVAIEEANTKVLQAEEHCKVAQLKLRQYQEDHTQHSHEQQQTQEQEQQIRQKHYEQMAQLQAQIQDLRDAASAAALQSIAATDQLRSLHALLADQRNQAELLQQERHKDEVAHQRDQLEKEEVVRCKLIYHHAAARDFSIDGCSLLSCSASVLWRFGCSNCRLVVKRIPVLHMISFIALFQTMLQEEEAKRLNAALRVLEIEPNLRMAHQTPSKPAAHAPPPPPPATAPPQHLQQQSIRHLRVPLFAYCSRLTRSAERATTTVCSAILMFPPLPSRVLLRRRQLLLLYRVGIEFRCLQRRMRLSRRGVVGGVGEFRLRLSPAAVGGGGGL